LSEFANVEAMITGTTLRRLRLESGRQQGEVAASVGIPGPVLSAYERGRRQPGLEIAQRIVAELGWAIELRPLPAPDRQAARLVEVLALVDAFPVGTSM
jgi:transcriptional regulator with XRE-family HTH domain